MNIDCFFKNNYNNATVKPLTLAETSKILSLTPSKISHRNGPFDGLKFYEETYIPSTFKNCSKHVPAALQHE